eukprot:scaffold8119_cov258-Pinguiococcus_pyrenoidosus.AAC.3
MLGLRVALVMHGADALSMWIGALLKRGQVRGTGLHSAEIGVSYCSLSGLCHVSLRWILESDVARGDAFVFALPGFSLADGPIDQTWPGKFSHRYLECLWSGAFSTATCTAASGLTKGLMTVTLSGFELPTSGLLSGFGGTVTVSTETTPLEV